MNLKQLIGNNAFFVINKQIMKKVGLEAALLLQHLIDLEDNYFKGIEFYQQVSRLIEDTTLSEHQIREAKRVLVDTGAISIVKKGIPAKDYFIINHDAILVWFNEPLEVKSETSKEQVQKNEPLEVKSETSKEQVQKMNHKDKETNPILDEEEKKKTMIFYKLVDMYPKNKIGNRKHGLTAFKKLNLEQAKTALINLNRYLKTVNDSIYIKSFLNYIDQECWSEEYLKLEEAKSIKRGKDTKHNIPTNYNDID
jgi:hypothetical protein